MTRRELAVVVDGDAVLRPLRAADLELTRQWRNDPDTRRWFHSSDPITADGHRAWFDSYLDTDDDFVFVAEVAGEPVGQVALSDITPQDAEFGRLVVDPARRGAGLSHRVILLCLRIADDEFRLPRVHLEVKPENDRAIRGYERAGFHPVEGVAGTGGAIVMERRRA